MSPLSNPIENVDLPRQARQRFTVSCNAALKWANAREVKFPGHWHSLDRCRLFGINPGMLAGMD
jgi:predicted Rdx family selenoprotein